VRDKPEGRIPATLSMRGLSYRQSPNVDSQNHCSRARVPSTAASLPPVYSAESTLRGRRVSHAGRPGRQEDDQATPRRPREHDRRRSRRPSTHQRLPCRGRSEGWTCPLVLSQGHPADDRLRNFSPPSTRIRIQLDSDLAEFVDEVSAGVL